MKVRKLETWITLAQAAKILGMTKQGVYKQAFFYSEYTADELRHVGDKPFYLISEAAVRSKAAERCAEAAERKARREAKVSKSRVVDVG